MYNAEIRKKIEYEIENFVKKYDNNTDALVGQLWRKPIIGYADATVVLCCFVPFTKAVALSNKSEDNLASQEWAQTFRIC